MININIDIKKCRECGVDLQEYHQKWDSKQIFKRCPKCIEVYCITFLDSNSYETRIGGVRNV